MFVDRIRVFAQAGNGGSGCVSFRREKFVPRGGPDGGDGGRGGDIILRADVHTDNLANLYYEPIIKAKSGASGMGKQMHGRSSPSKVVNVPIGAIVYRTEPPGPRRDDLDDSQPPETETPNAEGPTPSVEPEPIGDLTKDGEEFILCAGGRGGK